MIGRKLESFQTIIGGRNKAERPLKPNPARKIAPTISLIRNYNSSLQSISTTL